jgi:hypothetical protein
MMGAKVGVCKPFNYAEKQKDDLTEFKKS